MTENPWVQPLFSERATALRAAAKNALGLLVLAAIALALLTLAAL